MELLFMVVSSMSPLDVTELNPLTMRTCPPETESLPPAYKNIFPPVAPWPVPPETTTSPPPFPSLDEDIPASIETSPPFAESPSPTRR